MTSKLLHIKQVCEDLIKKEQRHTVFEILEFYYPQARTTADYDVVGALALKAEHHHMYLQAAIAAYSSAASSEEIFCARINLYKAYNTLNYPNLSMLYVEQHLEIEPDSFDANMQKAFNLTLMNRRVESEAIIQSQIAETPKQEALKRNALNSYMLRSGHTAEGILDFIDTFKPTNQLFEHQLKMQKWSGGAQPGRTIYVNGEGGVGDEIINIRFFDHLKDLGMTPILYSSWSLERPDIVDLFRRHGHEVITETYSIKPEHLWTNLMPLPGYLGLKEKDLWRGTYLTPQKDPSRKLQGKKFKIGIKCNGNPYFTQEIYRCIPIDQLIDHLPKQSDVEIYYFDKEKTHNDCVNMNDRLHTWEHTLDYLDQMDVVVSSCTSLVHAAGAMGVRTIVLVPIAEYYVWSSTRTDNTSPWYGDNFTVLKQTKLRSWHEPLLAMQELVEMMINES
jgi:hypothetical protein